MPFSSTMNQHGASVADFGLAWWLATTTKISPTTTMSNSPVSSIFAYTTSEVILALLVNGTLTIPLKGRSIHQSSAYSGPSDKIVIILLLLKECHLAPALVSRPGEIGGSGLDTIGVFLLGQTVPLCCSLGDRVPLSVAMTMMGPWL